MSYEVEVKYRLVDHERLRAQLSELDADPKPVVQQLDTYFNHPARDFAVTNEAFRIRRNGHESRITYKGPRRRGPTKTREEIEIALADGEKTLADLVRLFEILAFRPVATISKSRESYHITKNGVKLEVALDRTEGLGDFAEIEAIAASEGELPGAQAAVLALATQLGLTDVEPRSYLRIFLESVKR
jgi:adenylate cyclase class 2